MHYYDLRQLKQDIPIENVLDSFGLNYRKNGTFKCVSKEHNDKNPSMSINHKNNTCHCFSCNATFNPLELTMQELGCGIREAAGYLIEHFQMDRSIYVLEDDETALTDPDPFPFKQSEIRLLGLQMTYSFVLNDDYTQYQKIDEEVQNAQKRFHMTDEQAHEEQRFLEDRARSMMRHDGRISLNTMYKSDKEGFYCLIHNCAQNKLAQCEEQIQGLKNIYNSEKTAYYRSGTKEFRNQVVSAYLKFVADPFSTNKEEDELLSSKEAKKVLSKYIPLRETHQLMDEAEKTMSDVRQIDGKVPEKYRSSLDEILDVVLKEDKTEEMER